MYACQKNISVTEAPEDFDVFYDKFHQDQGFQMERVRFPLEGTLTDDEGEKNWERENWQMHRAKVTDITTPNYDTEIIRKENEVIDRVKLRDSGFFMQRKFRRIDGEWFLTFYEKVDL